MSSNELELATQVDELIIKVKVGLIHMNCGPSWLMRLCRGGLDAAQRHHCDLIQHHCDQNQLWVVVR